MFANQLFPVLSFAILLHICICNENESQILSRRKLLQEQALNTYKVACLRLQVLANWMSVLFKLKSAWTSTTTRTIMTNPKLNIEKGVRNVLSLPERPKVSPDGNECSSLKSLHVTLQTYIHFQAQLLQLKAVLGSLALRTGKSQLDATSAAIQGRIGNLDILNKTSLDIFDKLKQSSQFLTAQDSSENLNFMSMFRDIQKSPMSYLQEQKNDLHRHTQEEKYTQDLNKELFQAGGFFQNLGQALDKILVETLFRE